MPLGFIAVWLFLLLVFLLPLFIADAVLGALMQLGLSPSQGVLTVMLMLLGGLFNVPVYRRHTIERMPWLSRSLVSPWWQGRRHVYYRQQQVIAINIGGCLVPLLLVFYQFWRLANQDFNFVLLVLAVLVNMAVCYRLSRLIPGVGIAMPALLPGIVAALTALLLAPAHAPEVAFCAGVLGPLLGADLLRLGQIMQLRVGVASIGGAGTFDGIVISGFVATLLA